MATLTRFRNLPMNTLQPSQLPFNKRKDDSLLEATTTDLLQLSDQVGRDLLVLEA
jgi:hypothetical protein